MKLTGVFSFLALALPVVLSSPALVRRGGYEDGTDGSSDYGKSGDDSSTSTLADGSGSWATTTTTTLYTSPTTSSETTWASTSTSSSSWAYPSETGIPIPSSPSSSSSSSSSVATCEFDRYTGEVVCVAASSSASASLNTGSVEDDVFDQHDKGTTHGFDDDEGGEGDNESHEGESNYSEGEPSQDGNGGSYPSCSSSSGSGSTDESLQAHREQDVRLLNLALSVSHMSQAFYNQSLCAYSEQDFVNMGYPSWVRDHYKQVKEHQDEHASFLYKEITEAGGSAIMECEYTFSEVTDVKHFVERSEAIETIAASAFNGLLKHLHDDNYRSRVSSMMATQARHATWISSAVRHKNPWNTAYETPISLNMTFSLMNNFVVPGSCPSSNDISTALPHNVVDYPSLDLPERIKAGHKTVLSFNASSSSGTDVSHGFDKHGLYAAFKAGTETYYEKVWTENARQYVMVPEEVKAKGAVYIVIVRKDEDRAEEGDHSPSSSSSSWSGSWSGSDDESDCLESSDGSRRRRFEHHAVIAGPALVMFPFNSEGKSVPGLQGTSKW